MNEYKSWANIVSTNIKGVVEFDEIEIKSKYDPYL